jgi:hypothetical protein
VVNWKHPIIQKKGKNLSAVMESKADNTAKTKEKNKEI